MAPHLRVGFVLLDQFTLMAFSGLIDAVRLAADHGGLSRQLHAAWTVMSSDGLARRSSCGVVIQPDGALRDPCHFDYIAVCGGNDYLNRVPDGVLSRYLQAAAAASVRVVGICTGSFAIAQSGIVGRRKVCVHWNVLDAFRAQFPALNASVDTLFIDEGDIITCAGSTAAIDLGLYLIGRHCGRDKVRQVQRHMMLQDTRSSLVPQPHFYAHLDGVKDVGVRQAAHFFEQRLDTPPNIEAVARYVGVTPRQLERKFRRAIGVTPTAFQRRLRLDYSCWLMQNSIGTITQIGLDCGFSDGAHFAREFRLAFGMSPRDYKRQVSKTAAAATGDVRAPPMAERRAIDPTYGTAVT